MTLNSLIFSEKRSDHIKRHLLFWFLWWLYFGALHAANSFGKPDIMYFRNIPFTMLESLVMMIPHLLLTYALLLFVVPRYLLQKKYLVASVYIIILVFITGVINLYLVQKVNPWVTAHLLPERFRVAN